MSEPDAEVEREKLMALIERRLSSGSLTDAPYVWPDLLDDGHPGGFFEKWLNVTGHNQRGKA